LEIAASFEGEFSAQQDLAACYATKKDSIEGPRVGKLQQTKLLAAR
jgi:hypothetical protein